MTNEKNLLQETAKIAGNNAKKQVEIKNGKKIIGEPFNSRTRKQIEMLVDYGAMKKGSKYNPHYKFADTLIAKKKAKEVRD